LFAIDSISSISTLYFSQVAAKSVLLSTAITPALKYGGIESPETVAVIRRVGNGKPNAA